MTMTKFYISLIYSIFAAGFMYSGMAFMQPFIFIIGVGYLAFSIGVWFIRTT